MQQADIEDGIPTEVEVEQKVRGMKGGIAEGLLVIRAEDLKRWLREATLKKEPVSRRRELLVILVKRMFGCGMPSEELVWATMVLIPKVKKGGGGRGVIDLVVEGMRNSGEFLVEAGCRLA